MHVIPPEREYSNQFAMENIKHWLTKNDVHSALYTGTCDLVANVELKNKAGHTLSKGSGKGDTAIVAAYFEAVEKLLREHHFISSHIEVLPLNVWLTSNQSHPDCLFTQTLSEYNTEELLKFSYYNSLLTSKTYLIPDTLVNPSQAEPLVKNEAFYFLKRYRSHNGWASGTSFEESVLHGANEVIEQHCFSEFYKQYVGYSECTGEFMRVLPPVKLMKKYQSAIERPDELSVILYENQFGSYFCACFLPSPISPRALRSSSVSYSQYHAIEQAIAELTQQLENYDGAQLKTDIKASDFLSKYDKLRDLNQLPKLGCLPCVDLSNQLPDPMDFRIHYDYLLSSLETLGYDLLVHTAFTQENLWLTSTYIPGLERFNLIDKGVWVVPLGDLGQLSG